MRTESDRTKTGNGGKAEDTLDVQQNITALQDEVSRLTQQLATVVAEKGNEAWLRTRAGLDDMISDAGAKGREATDAVREVRDNLAGAINESIEQRPYTTLALALGLGVILGAVWRR